MQSQALTEYKTKVIIAMTNASNEGMDIKYPKGKKATDVAARGAFEALVKENDSPELENLYKALYYANISAKKAAAFLLIANGVMEVR